jgi:hypothetical protein
MEAKDLRIGSWVKLPNHYFEEKVESIGDFEDRGRDYVNGYSMDLCKPIPLTEEWLLRFGFEKDKDNVTWHLNNGLWMIQNIGMYLAFGSNKWQIQYVHSLQNLFHSLTGQELELKQKSPDQRPGDLSNQQ